MVIRMCCVPGFAELVAQILRSDRGAVILGGYLLALSRLGPVMDQVGRSHGGAQTFAHNLSQGFADFDLQVYGVVIALGLAGRNLDRVVLKVHRRLEPRNDIVMPLQAC